MKKRIIILGLLAALALTGCSGQTSPERSEQSERTEQPEQPDIAAGGTVDADWADEFLASHAEGEYTAFTADSSEYGGRVVFSSAEGVSDFKLLALTLEECGDDGGITYGIEEIYTLETLAADMPLVVDMTFAGAVPNYGISYDNNAGEIRRFAVSVSGYDGSVILSEF